MADAPPPDAVFAAEPGAQAEIADMAAPSPPSQSPWDEPPPEGHSPDGASPNGQSPAALTPAAPTPADQQPSAQIPTPQLPVVDLIGLRFSLQHLRLVGYGLLAVWGSEIVNLITSPRLTEIGTRLHYISQFLDLSPILLVAIGLIAFQGGLRRQPLEHSVLPLLLTLLPLLSAFHFFLAPISAANMITLVQKQQQVGLDQIEKIDQQIDRAATILRDSDSIDTLLEGLQRIPGLQVRVPAKASVSEARQEVRRSLERERDRLKERIEGNLSATREAFLRRAITNALLALVVGLLLWGLHHGAMREMEQAIPFLDWVLVQGEVPQQPEDLHDLLRFQRACVALGWFSLLERCLRLVRRVVRRPRDAALADDEERQHDAEPQVVMPPPNPFEHPRRSGRVFTPSLRISRLDPSLIPFADSDTPPDPDSAEEQPPDRLAVRMQRRQASSQRREDRRRQRDLARYRALRQRIEREGRDPFAIFAGRHPEPLAPAARSDARAGRPLPVDGEPISADDPPWQPPDPAPLSPRALRRLERDHRRARTALLQMSQSDQLGWQLPEQERLEQEHLADELRQELEWQRQLALQRPASPNPRPRGLAGLWQWFLHHL